MMDTKMTTFNDEKQDDYEEKYLSSDLNASGSSGSSSFDYGARTEGEGLLDSAERLEAQPAIDQVAPHVPAERHTSFTTKMVFLAAYFLLNLTLTVSNKALLGQAKFPWLLTTLHASSTSIGCFFMMGLGYLEVKRLTSRESLILTAFSFLFTLNIAISNVSLAAVSIPFHQIMRSTCPLVTILIYRLVYGRTYGRETYISMIPLVLGVAVATAGDYYATIVGFLLTALGVILASVKTVATNRLITGKFSPMEVLLLMSPLAATQCVVYAFLTGEVAQLQQALADGMFSSPWLKWGLLLNAIIAFGLNVISFQTNKVAGALTMSVCGNVKQALTIALGIVLFNVHVGLMNAVGMLITMGGAAYYSKVELDVKRSKSQGR